MLKAVIFDMDGVLVDTEPLHYRINQMIFHDMGRELPYEYYKQFIGSTNTHMWTTIIRDYNLEMTPDELNALVYAKKEEILQTEGYPEIAGVRAFVASLHAAGYRLAVASSSAPEMIEKMTEGVGVRSYFERIVSGETVERPKPAPDVFLKAAESLNVSPEECLVIEDSHHGVCAAKAAGMACLGFANPGSGEQDLSAADYLFESFESLSSAFLEMVWCRHHKKPVVVGESERVLVREFCADDFTAVTELHARAASSAISPRITDDEAGRELFLSYIDHVYRFFCCGYYAVIEKAGGRLIGEVGFSAEGELGYLILPEKRRQGFARESCALLFTYAKEVLGFSALRCRVMPENEASASFAASLGFVFAGEKEGMKVYERNL